MKKKQNKEHKTKVETFDDGTILVSIDGKTRWAGKKEDAVILAKTIISEVEK